MSQFTDLAKAMKSKHITPIDALNLCGCFRFSARIGELKKVYNLDQKWVVLPSGKRVKAFKIKGIKGNK